MVAGGTTWAAMGEGGFQLAGGPVIVAGGIADIRSRPSSASISTATLRLLGKRVRGNVGFMIGVPF
jgi:hypothetical protein